VLTDCLSNCSTRINWVSELLPIDQLSFRSHVLALKPKVKGKRLATATETLTHVVLDRWQELSFPALWTLRGKPNESLKRRREIDSFVEWLRCKPLLESAFWLSSAFASWIDAEERSDKAMFFTPPALADRLIDSLIKRGASFDKSIWHDPAGGGGAFIAPLAERLCHHLGANGCSSVEILQQITTCVTAVEIDPTLTFLARQYVYMVLSRQIEDVCKLPELQIFQADSLSFTKTQVFDVVICNPPYRKLQSDEIVKFKTVHLDVMTGQSNLYGLFMKRSIQLLKPGGLAGLITPTSFISGLHFRKLRSYLLSNSALLQIDFIQERLGIFIGVEQGAAATIFQQQENGNHGRTDISSLLKGKVQSVGAVALKVAAPVWIFPRSENDVELVNLAASCKARLSDYGYQVRIGNFVAYRDDRPTFTEKSLPKQTACVYPLIWAADISTTGTLTHGHHQRDGDGAVYVMNDSSTVLAGVEKIPSVVIQRVTSPDQKKRLISAPVPRSLLHKWGGVIGENHVIFLVPSKPAPELTPTELSDLISSGPVDLLYRCLSGAVNISAHELNNLPLPSPEVLKQLKTKNSLSDSLVLEAYALSGSAT
jgi:adenine-specific DNA-methyltransferase